MLKTEFNGQTLKTFQITVDRTKIKELAKSVNSKNQIFLNKDLSILEGYSDTPAPLTYGNLMIFWGCPELWDEIENIGMDLKRMLHTQEEYEYFEPIYPGDELLGTIKIEDMYVSEMAEKMQVSVTFTRKSKIVLIMKLDLLMPGVKNG